MTAVSGDKKRRILPRWRDSRVLDASSESGVTSPSRSKVFNDDVLTERLRDWKLHKDVFFATDLVGAALVYNKKEVAREAAEYLLRNRKLVPAPALRLARIALGKEEANTRSTEPSDSLPDSQQSRIAIRELRRSLIRDPRNVLHRVDMARHYAALGLKKHAEQEMSVALHLVPQNRFVLRAANRLLVHVDQKDRALTIIRNNERTKVDPWLMAAEIATSSVVEKSPRFAKTARALLESKRFAPQHVSELASALGTLEFEAGSNKTCKKMLKVSLEAPTDNSVAQAEWIYEQLGDVGAISTHLTVPRSFEARARDSSAAGRWKDAERHSMLWLADEPFSSRPAMLGSFVSAVGTEDYQTSERFCRLGLAANQHDAELRHNLIFALVGQDRLEEAQKEHDSIPIDQQTGEAKVQWLANAGLLSFRKGDVLKGRDLYQKAVTKASEMKNRELAFAAMSFWTVEEARIQSEVSAKLLETLERAPKGVLDPAHERLIEKAKRLRQDRSLMQRLGTALRSIPKKT